MTGKGSEVFFSSAKKSQKSSSLYHKLRKVILKMGIGARIEPGDVVAVKLHFGERGNTGYLRPIYARVVVDAVKKAGGQPFLTDTTTLYKRSRHSLFSYLETARDNGYTAETMGCPVLIADGFRNSGTFVEIENPVRLPRAKVAQLIYESDFMISLAHVTFHPDMSPASALKNVAMGCTTKETKLNMHNSVHKPDIDAEACKACGHCVRICPGLALALDRGRLVFEPELCVGCADCIAVCPSGAISVPWGAALDTQRGVVDGFRAVVSAFEPGRIAYINMGIDISELCDCLENNGLPVVPDIGILASWDPVAVDKATHDMILGSMPYPGSVMDTDQARTSPAGKKVSHQTLELDEFFANCVKSGLGSASYFLTEVG